MTAKRNTAARMAAAAALTTSPDAPSVTRTAVRTEPVRITVDLQPAAYTGLHKWLADATEVGQPKLTLSDAVRALVDELRDDPQLRDRVRDRVWEGKRR